jgi:hypothetical protein
MEPLMELETLTRRVRFLESTLGCALAVIVVGVPVCLILGNQLQRTTREVKTRWRGETLHLSNIQGRLLITGLAQGGIAAKLPAPILLVDSEGAGWEVSELKKLSWRNEGGGEEPAPRPGSSVQALFIRLESSEFRP